MGFITGASACAAINKHEIEQRRGDLPKALRTDPNGDPETGEVPINEDTLSTLMELLGKIFSSQATADVVLQAGRLPRREGQPAGVVLPGHQHHRGRPARRWRRWRKVRGREHTLPQGDDTALSIVMSQVRAGGAARTRTCRCRARGPRCGRPA